ncbi:hypothetical protein HK100_007815, partial [Physocladia obscura]
DRRLDRARFQANLSGLRGPLWLLLFPEGRLNWQGARDQSRAFAAKSNLPADSHPVHLILPRALGLFLALDIVYPQGLEDLFDVTVAYEGIRADQIPYDVFLPDRMFFDAEYPKNIHMHVRRFPIKDIPGFSDSDIATLSQDDRLLLFDVWLNRMWLEKDQLMTQFFEYGELGTLTASEPRMRVPLIPHSNDWIQIALLFSAAYFLLRFYWSVVRFSFSLIARVLLSIFDFVGLEPAKKQHAANANTNTDSGMDVLRSLLFGGDSIPGSTPGSAGAAPASLDTDPNNLATTSGVGSVSVQQKRKPIFFVNLVIFAALISSTALAVCLLGLPAAILLVLVRQSKAGAATVQQVHRWFRAYVRHLERAFAAMLVLIAAVFLRGSVLVVTGDWDKIDHSKKNLVFSNHQIYPDWYYLWLFAWFRNCQADFRIVLIKVLASLPLLGQGMQLFEFIFLNQKLAQDRAIIHSNLSTAVADGPHNPLFLLIFPEGTLNTPGNVSKSRAYAEKHNIKNHPQHCILPKSTGLFVTLQDLASDVNECFDLTVAYGGVKADEVPYDVLLPDKVYLEGKYPREIHFDVRRYEIAKLPGFRTSDADTAQDNDGVAPPAIKEEFDAWLRSVWTDKDTKLANFYATNALTNDRKEIVPLIPRVEDWVYFIALFAGFYVILPVYARISYWTVVVGWRIAVDVIFAGLVQVFGVSRLTVWAAFMVYFKQTVGIDDVTILV